MNLEHVLAATGRPGKKESSALRMYHHSPASGGERKKALPEENRGR